MMTNEGEVMTEAVSAVSHEQSIWNLNALWRRGRGLRRAGAALAVAAALAAGCSSGGDSTAQEASSTTPAATAATTSEAPTSTATTESEAPAGVFVEPNVAAEHTVTFDALGGGDPTIKVYQGPGDSGFGRKANGIYKDGEEVGAYCVTEGREVPSNPGVGEEQRTSKLWVMIDGQPDKTEFATATYLAQSDEELLATLGPCEPS